MKIIALDHVQLAMPKGRESEARAFYSGLLGIPEISKPPVLAARGGCWFEDGPLRLHLGVEAEFRPARKAHPGLQFDDLDALIARLEAHGVAIVPDDTPGTGPRRVFVADPFGNRIELIDADDA